MIRLAKIVEIAGLDHTQVRRYRSWLRHAILAIAALAIQAVTAAQIAAAVVTWAGRILTYITALVTSLTNLSRLLNG